MAEKKYIVLFPIQPDEGPGVFPAIEGEPFTVLTDADLADLFARTPREGMTPEQRIQIMIDNGTLAPEDAVLAELVEGKRKAKQREAAAAKLAVQAGLVKNT